MPDVLIRYKQPVKDREEAERGIIIIACDYDWIGVSQGKDFCMTMGHKRLDEFCEKVRGLDYVESVEVE